MALAEIGAVFTTLKTVLDTLKAAKDMLPDEKKHAIEVTLIEAEKASALAEANIVKALGGQLCWCTNPPQVMREEQGRSSGFREFTCQQCGNTVFPKM